jgi:hypothetical protein
MAVAMAEDGSRTDWSTFLFEIRKLAKKSFAGIQSDQILGQMLAEAVMVLDASGRMETALCFQVGCPKPRDALPNIALAFYQQFIN